MDSRGKPLAGALVLGLLTTAAVLFARFRLNVGYSDFDQIVSGARLMLSGISPYRLTPSAELPWPLYYPAPALVLAIPFVGFPLAYAHALFAGVSAAIAYWCLARANGPRLFGFATYPFALSTLLGQWSVLLLATTAAPSLAWVVLAKPNLGLALLAGYGPSWFRGKALRGNLLVGIPLVAMSFNIRPTWYGEWLTILRQPHEHMVVPLTVLGGPLLLLGLVRWRRPEARFLAALACVPQTFASYDMLLLFAVVETRREALVLVTAMAVMFCATICVGIGTSYADSVHRLAPFRLAIVYLPALVMVLRRPNAYRNPTRLDSKSASPSFTSIGVPPPTLPNSTTSSG